MINRGLNLNSITRFKEQKAGKAITSNYKRILLNLVVILIIVTFILLSNIVVLPAAGYTAFSKRNGKIAFDAGQEIPFDMNTFEIYVMNADGGNRTRLTKNSVGDRWPNWSPDGQRIAFTRFLEDGSADIYVMRANGKKEVRLTNTPEFDELTPAWCPDGKQLAFTRGPGGSFVQGIESDKYEIFIIDIEGDHGAGLEQLTSNGAEDSSPAWSPDGKLIAFTSNRDGNYEIYVMKANGKKQTNLTNNPADDGFTFPTQTWSPDGKRIAFPSNRDGADFLDFDIYVMKANGKDQTNLTNRPGFDGSPAWSANGKQITFSTFRDEDGSLEIYAMNAADGSHQTNLTKTGGPGQDEIASDWQPMNRD